jgi:ubiquinone/menaquinone biosynthesis C-methylase UbiE
MEFTGERYIPSVNGAIRYEHLHRYAVAMQYVQGKSVLDIACGEGYGSYYLSQTATSVVGVDIDPESVAHAQKNYGAKSNLTYQVGNCSAIPLPDRSIDVVTSFETIEHHDQHTEMIKEIKRVLKPDGLLLISSPNKLTYSDEPGTQNPFHVKELYLDEFLDLLKDGFNYIEMLGQKLATGSFIMPIAEVVSPQLMTFTSQNSATEEILRIGLKGFDSSIYFIAICSDNPLLENSSNSSLYMDEESDLWKETNSYLHEIHDALKEKQAQLHMTIEQNQVELHKLNEKYQSKYDEVERCQQELASMKETKIWKLREKWLRVKGRS